MQTDIEIWSKYVIFGIGPGALKYYRKNVHGRKKSPHTEYTRLLSEHGSFGLIALVLLGLMVFKNWLTPRSIHAKAISGPMLYWSLL